jgi:hypothetical protein
MSDTNESYDKVSAEGEDNFARNEKIADLGDGAPEVAGAGDQPDAIGETAIGEDGVDTVDPPSHENRTDEPE